MQIITSNNNIANMVREFTQEIPVIVQRSQALLPTSAQVLATSQDISGDMKHANILGMITMVPQIEEEVQQGVVVMQQIIDQLKQLEAMFKQPGEGVVEVLNEWH